MSAETARLSLAAGDVDAAREALMQAVRKAPGDVALRVFLFQLSAVIGDWERAGRQLDTAAEMSGEAAALRADYGAAIEQEAVRAAVLAGRQAPSVFGGPRPWSHGLAEAFRLEAAGDADGAAQARLAALDLAPEEPGTHEGARFPWIMDADPRFGPAVEAVLNGEYRWIPLEEIRSLTVEPPTDLRDAVWTVGTVMLIDGAEWPVLLHTRYPGAEASADGAIRLARRTDWTEGPMGLQTGMGQRIFALGDTDVGVMDLRALVLDRPPLAEDDAADEGGGSGDGDNDGGGDGGGASGPDGA